ncbi:condensation domain-containing protein [Actinoplanes sp. HUAS TT8]|uniref:condensation domain-containing protein n=1 Tax=Actinoplanes sp. HUAS TT8 TaxID=3447453 RepID=UPI003F51B7E2
MSSSTLTVQQESMLLLNKVAADGVAYNMVAAVTLRPALPHDRWAAALRTMLRRHDVLRSTFHLDGDGARRLVSDDITVPLDRIEGAALSAAELRRVAQDFVHRRFDLAVESPLRALLVERGPDEAVLVLAVHHVAMDFHSLGILLEELITRAVTPETPLPEATRTFAEYAQRAREWTATEAAAADRDYWTSLLRDVDPVLALPTDLVRPPSYRHVGDTVTFEFGDDLVRELTARCRDLGVTPFSFLLTTFSILLFRYSGQRQFVVGTPFSTRSRRESDVVGPFVNTIPVRVEVSEEHTVATLAQDLARQVAAAAEHARYPFPDIIADLGIGRDPSRTPLVQTLLTFLASGRTATILNAFTAGGGSARVGDHEFEVLDLRQQEGQVEIGLELYWSAGAVRGRLKFNDDLYSRAMADQLVAHYVTCTTAAVRDPATRAAGISLVSEDERARLLSLAMGG